MLAGLHYSGVLGCTGCSPVCGQPPVDTLLTRRENTGDAGVGPLHVVSLSSCGRLGLSAIKMWRLVGRWLELCPMFQIHHQGILTVQCSFCGMTVPFYLVYVYSLSSRTSDPLRSRTRVSLDAYDIRLLC